MEFFNRCPMCATSGKVWHREPVVFHCPNCTTLYSRFGILIEREREQPDQWN